MTIYVSIAVCVFLVGGAMTYNAIVVRRNGVDNAFGGIDAQLKKRYDLIPNLVATVREYAKHEREVFQELVRLRTRAIAGDLTSEETIEIDNAITQHLGRLMVQVESYPDLRASTNFVELQHSLNEVEAQISAARRAYNAAVVEYNNAIETLPGIIMARPFGFTRRAVFEIPPEERRNVDVADIFQR